MSLLRGGLIGCGFFASNHMHAWAELDEIEIVAVCDRDAAKADAMARTFGIAKTYTDAAEMVRSEKLDFVDIATTSASHRALTEIAAPHVGAIICQKPMADSMAEGQAMVAAAAAAGIPLLVHENFRWQKPFREIARLLQEGAVGVPQFARFSFRHRYDAYRTQPYLAEIEHFTLMDIGLHLFDLSRSLVGEAEHLSCRTQRINPIVRGEDAFTALVGHANGATSVIDCSFYSRISPEPFPQTTAWIEGSGGTLELDRHYRLTMHTGDGRQTIDVEPPVPTWGGRPWHLIQESVAAFEAHAVDVMAGRAEAQPSGSHNLKTLAMALSAYEAAAEERVIDLRSWRQT